MQIFKKIARFQALLFSGSISKSNYYVPVDEQFKYLSALREPNDDVERMKLKYECQKGNSSIMFFFLNVISLVILPIILLLFLFRRVNRVEKSKTDLLILDALNINEVFPQELYCEFPNYKIIFFDGIKDMRLKIKDISFIFSIFIKYKIEPYLLLRFTTKLAQYRNVIELYHPKAIAITNELSPTSVAMTHFCKMENVEHINFMHGEKFYEIGDSFIHFNRCYVFDNYYVKLFLTLKADVLTKFIIHTAPKFKIDLSKFRLKNEIVDFTYFLQMPTKNDIINIVQIVKKMIEMGYSIRIRPHPRFTDLSLLHEHCPAEIIEDTLKFSPENSIASCRNVISVHSAILYQAQVCGVSVVFDDVCFKKDYEVLLDKKYIVFMNKYERLSYILNM